MDAWLIAIVNSAIGGVRDLAAAAMERMLWLYAIVVSVGSAIRSGWNTVTGAARFWRTKIWSFAAQLYGTLWYIVNIRIPITISTALESATSFLMALIDEAERRLSIGLSLLQNWIVARVNEFLDFAEQLRQYLLRRFSEIWDWADRIGHLVFTLLTSPQNMAEWLFGALIGYTIKYIDENAESIGDLIRRRAVHYAGRIAARVEGVLVRLL